MTKGADGTTRMITGPTSILPKTPTTPGGQQSLIKLQTPSGQNIPTVQLQAAGQTPGERGQIYSTRF